jgi:hypothetical protein
MQRSQDDGMPAGGFPTSTRRSFLRRTAAGLSGAIMAQAFALDALAYRGALETGLQYLNHTEAATVEAIAMRIWPGDAEDPGAREGGTLYYIDRALAGAYKEQALGYSENLKLLDRICAAREGAPFALLDEAKQDEILALLEKNGLEGFPNGNVWFATLRTHTLEGMFSDPIYGGNRDFAGWKAVGYPGAYFLWDEKQQTSFEPLDVPYQSVADL